MEDHGADFDPRGLPIDDAFGGALGHLRFGRARDVGQPGWRQAPQIVKELQAPHTGTGGEASSGMGWLLSELRPQSLSAGRQQAVRGRAGGRRGGAIGPDLAGCRGGSRCGVIADSSLR